MSGAELGHIESVTFGYGGYQDAQFGVSFTLTFDGYHIGDFWGYWGMEPSDHAKWTRADQSKTYASVMRRIQKLMDDAKVRDINDLKGKPISVALIGNALSSWRILTEVL